MLFVSLDRPMFKLQTTFYYFLNQYLASISGLSLFKAEKLAQVSKK